MAPPSDEEMKLEQLAERAGVSPRTVRYYVQRGLLRPAAFRGRDTVYTPDHLTRLLAIRQLQEQFLPLDAIQVELERLDPVQLRRLAEDTDAGTLRSAPQAPRPSVPTGRAAAASSGDGVSRWERWELAPGVELHVSEDADATARALVEQVRGLIATSRRHRRRSP